MTCKMIEQLCGDMTLSRKRVEDYESVISAYLSLNKASSLCH